MNFLVSAGPTREMIDDVRFLSNLSSGRTGFAAAEAARDRGHDVTLVTGPVALSPPSGITVVAVTSAREMHRAMLDAYPDADAVIMTAAVCDYRPAKRMIGKVKKAEGVWQLELARNPDILAELGRARGDRVLIGFALEVQDAETHARDKLGRKNLDLIVLNGPANFASGRSTFRLVTREVMEEPRTLSKPELGMLLVQRAEAIRQQRGGGASPDPADGGPA